MDDNLKEIHDRFVEEMRYVDEVAQVIIKGHLVLEEVISLGTSFTTLVNPIRIRT